MYEELSKEYEQGLKDIMSMVKRIEELTNPKETSDLSEEDKFNLEMANLCL